MSMVKQALHMQLNVSASEVLCLSPLRSGWFSVTSLWLERHKMAIFFYVCVSQKLLFVNVIANVHQCLHLQVFLLICFSLPKSLREFISKRITILNKFIV